MGVVVSGLGTSDMDCCPYEAEAASLDYYAELEEEKWAV